MTDYWAVHASETTNEKMMLDDNAETLGQYEIPEIISLLPEYKGRKLLELGAGIGRFTGALASQASSVIAVDFMQSFIEENEKTHGHMGNIDFRCGDVTKIELPSESVDVIFSNWLLMYLSDEEVQTLFSNMLTWLTPGGHLFFRESCFHSSGNASRQTNPTQYRDPEDYKNMISRARNLKHRNDGLQPSFALITQKQVKTYVEMKSNPNQICWLFKKNQTESS